MPLKGSLVSSSDIRLISRQMGGKRFDPAGVMGVARRCRWGVPQVLKCFPLRDWWPFPTTYWLSCPWLIRAVGALESCGGVSDLEDFLREEDRSSWIKYQMLHGIARISMMTRGERYFLRSYRRPVWDALRHGGIGGIDYTRSPDLSVKCLHLQVASWLALGHHPGRSWLESKIPEKNCGNRWCLSK